MPVHDWTRVDVGIFHDFHLGWITHIKKALNTGLLPGGHYALCEQHAERPITEVLDAIPPPGRRTPTDSPNAAYRELRRTLTIRQVLNHRLITLLEMVSPANKDRAQSVEEFSGKAASALRAGVHVMVVDLFPPGPHDPQGMHGAIQQHLHDFEEPCGPPADEPLTLAGYIAGPVADVFQVHIAVSSVLPDMPLFLRPDCYLNLALEASYQEAYRGMAAFWRNVLEGV